MELVDGVVAGGDQARRGVGEGLVFHRDTVEGLQPTTPITNEAGDKNYWDSFFF